MSHYSLKIPSTLVMAWMHELNNNCELAGWPLTVRRSSSAAFFVNEMTTCVFIGPESLFWKLHVRLTSSEETVLRVHLAESLFSIFSTYYWHANDISLLPKDPFNTCDCYCELAWRGRRPHHCQKIQVNSTDHDVWCVRYKKFIVVYGRCVDRNTIARLGLALIACQFECTVWCKEERNLQRTNPREAYFLIMNLLQVFNLPYFWAR